jgi:hypothetical protein
MQIQCHKHTRSKAVKEHPIMQHDSGIIFVMKTGPHNQKAGNVALITQPGVVVLQ